MTEVHCKYDEMVDPNTLVDHPRNHNKHPRRQLDALVAFIRHSGWRHPVVVSRLSGRIVAGHARKLAAIEIGCAAPVAYQDFVSETEERTFLAADNRLAELAEMDVEALNLEVIELQELDIPVVEFGFEINSEKPQKDVNPNRILIVEVRCDSESQQNEVFDLLTERGYQCKVMGI